MVCRPQSVPEPRTTSDLQSTEGLVPCRTVKVVNDALLTSGEHQSRDWFMALAVDDEHTMSFV